MRYSKLLILFVLIYASSDAQERNDQKPDVLRRISVYASVDLQGFSLPFSSMDTYKKNRGFSLGLGYSYNRSGSLQQRVKAGLVYNAYHGRSQYFSTSLQYNPVAGRSVTAGISLGAGYMRSGFAKGWQQKPNGDWFERTNTHGFLFIPASGEISIRAYNGKDLCLAPTISYSANALINYTPATFVTPQSFVSLGFRVNFK